jgi:GNAT superfamily N-acetyltransferase
MEVRAIDDRDLLHAVLGRDRVGCAYQIGDLDDAYFPWCKWWGAYREGDQEPKLLLLLYRGLSVPVALTVGDGDLLGDLLEEIRGELPDHFFAQIWEDHLSGLEKLFEPKGVRPMIRMALSRKDYTPVEMDPDTVRLGHRDTAQIVKLYNHYPDNFFEPYQLESGLYFGIHDKSGGNLVSITGIHVLSETFDVAVVGNLVTHPDHRGRNYARRVTARLLNELLERVSLVALNVAEDNVPALRTYEHFGFKRHCRFLEGMFRRRF